MRNTFWLFLVLLLISGCYQDFNKSENAPNDTFTISMAPAYAPSTGSGSIVPVNAQIILHASTVLDPATVNTKTVFIEDLAGNRQLADVSAFGSDIVIVPVVYLAPQTDYEIIVTTAIRDQKQRHLLNDFIIPITTDIQINATPPTLVTTLPLSGATYVEPFGTIYVQFSKPISPLNVDQNSFQLRKYKDTISIPGQIKVSGALLSFIPDSDLIDGQQYEFELNASVITDLAGNPYTDSTVINQDFTVGASVSVISIPEKAPPYSTNEAINTISTDTSIVFLGTNSGLNILNYNMSTTQFTLLSHLSASQVGAVYSIDINTSARRAYIGSSTGFSIVDISDYTRPLIKSHFSTLNSNGRHVPVYGLDIIAGRAYLAATTLGIVALDITNETQPTELFNTPTTGTAFDVKIIENYPTVCDYDQGIKRFDINGTPVTAPSPQDPGQDRDIFIVPSSDSAGNPSFDYYIASGIGGVKYWDSYNGTGLPTFQAAAYVSKLVQLRNTSTAYALIKDVGVAKMSGWSFQNYLRLSYDAVTLAYIDNTINPDILIIADSTGNLHTYEIQE